MSRPLTIPRDGDNLTVAVDRKDVRLTNLRKIFWQELAARHPALVTAEYRVAKRPRGRVLVDYNQNAWGRSLASIYSVRPR